jgi:ribose 5-phosphate isomerase B
MNYLSQKKKIFLASDHGGFEAKNYLLSNLSSLFPGEIIDLGCLTSERVDYPDYGKILALKILENSDAIGIALCGSGIGISIQVNRYKGIRGALCRSVSEAKLAREHNDANILCLPGRDIEFHLLLEIVRSWMESDFEGGRHQQRILKLDLN